MPTSVNQRVDISHLPAVFYTYSHYLAFSKKAPQPAIEKVKETLVRITNNGELAKITEKYFKF